MHDNLRCVEPGEESNESGHSETEDGEMENGDNAVHLPI